ncbi:MAG: cysteine desulfurase [Clostridia bacterium]|nr:cysteine desulfurase [Clostridia bacterium]
MDIYLDNSATTPLCKPAVDAMYKMMTETFGNPSSKHKPGNDAFDALKKARRRVADAIGCNTEEVYFTPSGTTANNTAIFGAARLMGRRGKRIITTSLEHPSVKEPMKRLESMGYEIVALPTNRDGKFSLSVLRSALTPGTILVSMMLVNNEIGAINPIADAAAMVKNSNCGALIHCDAVQGFGKLDIKPSKLGVDLLTVSSHKIHGPKGAGALYIKKGLHLPAYILGGGQENGMFSGTEATPAIAGFGAAAAALPSPREQLAKTKKIRDDFIGMLGENNRIFVNSPADALPYVINISIPGIPSEVLINYLSDNGIYVSAGSACKKGRRSDVLTAIGIAPQRIDSAIRISLSRFTTAEDMCALYTQLNEATKIFLR